MKGIITVLSIFFALLTGIFYYIGYRKYCAYADTDKEMFYTQSVKYMKLALLFALICFLLLFTAVIIYSFIL